MRHDDPVADAALDWFLRLRDGTGDSGTQRAFEDWLRQDPRHPAAFRAISALWDSADFGRAAARLPANLPAGPPARRWLRPVAAALLVVMAGAAAWQGPGLALALRADQMTARGEMRRVTLPDGSTLLLNSASAVALDFGDGRREVRLLRGEGYFDVRPDPAHPFRVTGGHGVAEVKGTAFAMRRDPDRDAIVLERGRLEVRCACLDQAAVTLLPGQETSVSGRGPTPAAPADPARELAWRQGRAVFSDVRLGTVVDELARHWPGRIIVARPGLRARPVSGSYRLDDIPGALASLAAATDARTTRLPGSILILR